MRKMIVWLLMLCLAISMAACHISLSGASGERENESEKQTEQDPEKETREKLDSTLPDSGLFPWGKPEYPEDPFLWITPETTLDELIAALGEPTEYDDGILTEPEYEGFILYGNSGELWFEFEDDGTLREGGFVYEHPGAVNWRPQEMDERYVPTAEEIQSAREYALELREVYVEEFGEIRDNFDGYGWRWDRSTEWENIKLEVIVNPENQHPVQIYYYRWNK
ncbi:MAG: hypothetical protein IJA48_07965 [Oscillospiraceae bacterium]|nr:hypothetical protein [Oscillospiraceae bacterium]